MVSQMSKQMSGMGMLGKMKAMTQMGPEYLAAMGAGKGAPQLPGGGAKEKPKFKERKKRR
jgi:hypothetical protein